MLARFTAEEIEDSIEDGAISVTCEFCGTKYVFDPARFAAAADEEAAPSDSSDS
jgi:molecular chaperone Hsp33